MFLWSDRLKKSGNTKEARNKLIEEYKATEATPFAAAAEGFIEDIIDPAETRAKVIANLEMLEGKRVSQIAEEAFEYSDLSIKILSLLSGGSQYENAQNYGKRHAL